MSRSFENSPRGVLRHDWATVSLEVVVVIVGLFLGLQLSDWAADKQDQQRLQTYYQQLPVDLEEDLSAAQWTTVAAVNTDALAQIVRRMTRGDDVTDVPDDVLVRATATSGYVFRPTATVQTYEELISTGQVALFPISS